MNVDEESPPSPEGQRSEPPSLPLPALLSRLSKNGTPPPNDMHDPYDINQDVENDDDVSQQMTASYSEISFKSDQSHDNELMVAIPSLDLNLQMHEQVCRPATLTCKKKTLGPLNLEGSIRIEGNMTHFVAEDLEYKIKLSSPQTKKGDATFGNSRSSTPNTLYRQLLVPQLSQVDAKLLNELEYEAQKIASSIDNLTENLCGILHSISSITADNVDVYKNAVSKMSDAMDLNIKSMYTMMAKAEEVTQAMKMIQAQAVRLKDIRRLVDLFDGYV